MMAKRKRKILGLRFQKKYAEKCGIFLCYNLYKTFCLTCKLSCSLRMGSSACLWKSPSKGWEVCSEAKCQQTLTLRWQLLQVVPPDSSRAARGCPGHVTPLPHPSCPSENFQGFKKSKYGNIIPWFCGQGGKEHEVLCWVLPTNVKFSHQKSKSSRCCGCCIIDGLL